MKTKQALERLKQYPGDAFYDHQEIRDRDAKEAIRKVAALKRERYRKARKLMKDEKEKRGKV